jgi:Zn-dependent protease
LIVAAAGPAVNAAIFAACIPVWGLIGQQGGGDFGQLWYQLYWNNLAMLLFNLMPIWPLDGGQLLLAVLRSRVGFARSKFIQSVFGIVCCSIGIEVCIHLRVWPLAIFFIAIVFANVGMLEWVMAVLAEEKEFGIHPLAVCPHCTCKAIGEDWDYRAEVGPIPCHYCGLESDGTAWLRAVGVN